MTSLSFVQIHVIELGSGGTQLLNVPAGKVWKIESAGIGGTSGSLLLKKNDAPVTILFTTISNNHFGCTQPIWLNDSYGASINNDSTYSAIVSISEWEPVTL